MQIRTARWQRLVSLAVCLLVFAALYLGGAVAARPGKLTFKALVDGTDVIKLRGSKLWIEHKAWKPPDQIAIDGKPWTPAWVNDKTSIQYELKPPLAPADNDRIRVTKHLGRGTVGILEMPSPENEQTLSVQVDDGPMGAADWYELTISW